MFDAPVEHPFTYTIPAGCSVVPGQRVWAPLHGAERCGLVVALREGEAAGLKPLARAADPAPLLTAPALDLARWISAQSLSTLGSTVLSLLPPPPTAGGPGPAVAARRTTPELLVGPGRETRLLEAVTAGPAALVLTADVDGAARWARRLGAVDRVARLDSGVSERARREAWQRFAGGDLRLAVGTRGALLAPLPAGAIVALVDEHEAAHKPPGPPRMHSRDVVLERAARGGVRALFTSATPSVEMWWRADSGAATLSAAAPAPWPAVTVADARGLGRRTALTPALVQILRETLRAGRRAFFGVSRRAAALGCDECGAVLRCPRCAVALAYSASARTLTCRVCADATPPVDTCPACRGRRLGPFGWSAERLEQALARVIPKARIARYDPDARGGHAARQRDAAAAADVVVGTRGALRLFGPASLGLAAFIAPDQLLGLPDFRAAERAFALMWAATERVRRDGVLVVQSRNAAHYALDALVKRDLGVFYRHELKFRAELGYPPFRRLALIGLTARGGSPAQALAADVAAALRGVPRLTVYPPTADRGGRKSRVVVKGEHDLPALLGGALHEFRRDRAESRGIMDVEVDPVEWPF